MALSCRGVREPAHEGPTVGFFVGVSPILCCLTPGFRKLLQSGELLGWTMFCVLPPLCNSWIALIV